MAHDQFLRIARPGDMGDVAPAAIEDVLQRMYRRGLITFGKSRTLKSGTCVTRTDMLRAQFLKTGERPRRFTRHERQVHRLLRTMIPIWDRRLQEALTNSLKAMWAHPGLPSDPKRSVP